MLDKHALKIVTYPLSQLAKIAISKNISANQVSVIGFLLGILAAILICFKQYELGLLFILLNRLADGLDGHIARLSSTQSPAGGFLDISLDFIFYALIPLAFIVSNPEENAIAGAVLITSFVATGSSFLAFASCSQEQTNPDYPTKSFYYLNGLIEGSETIFVFILFCLFPQNFTLIASITAGLCFLSAFIRIYFGFLTLNK